MGEAKRRMRTCAYCGDVAVSKDHVPPKGLFPIERLNLITVPACRKHNEDVSNLDERFREFLALTVGADRPTTEALWESVWRGLNQPEAEKRKAELMNSLMPMPDGNLAFKIDSDLIEGMLERITRGLFWHNFRRILPQELKVETYVFRNLVGLEAFLGKAYKKSIAAGQFQFAASQLEDEPNVSMWIYLIHNRFAAGATTNIEYVHNRLKAEGKVPSPHQ